MTKRITHELYDGEVNLDFLPDSHQYKIGKAKKRSVTGIIRIIDKPALKQWASNMACESVRDSLTQWATGTPQDSLDAILERAKYAHSKRAKDAQDIGIEGHAVLEDCVNADIANIPWPDPAYRVLENAVNQFASWADDLTVKFLAAERVVYSKEYDYAGTVDIVCRINGKLCIADNKFSKGFYPETYLQLAAYAQAIEEEDGEKVYDGFILRFDKETGDMEYDLEPNIMDHFDGFKAAQALQNWQAMAKKRIGG